MPNVENDPTDIGNNPGEGQLPPVTNRLLARRRGLLAALGLVIAAALAATLSLFYALGDDPVRPPSLAGDAHEMSGEATQTCDLEAYAKALSDSYDPYFGTLQRGELLALNDDPKYRSHAGFQSILAFDYLRFGEAEESIRVLTEALEDVQRRDPESREFQEVLEELAVTSLKAGELSNRVNPSARMVCTLPLGNERGYENTHSSANAIKHFLRLLELDPGNIKYRWLLNVAHMTLGTYPAGVPEQFLIRRELLAGDPEKGQDIGRFEEVASHLGLDASTLAGGSIMDDFDNDGLLDLVTSTWDPTGPLIYYHNDGDGSFTDRTVQAGLDGQFGGLNIVQTDYNNDGLLDILVMRGGWLLDRGTMRMSLLRNNGDGTFSDVTRKANLAEPAYPSQSAAWADFDNDGDLDFFSCNESEPDFTFPSQLFRNDGNSAFTDVALSAKVTNLRYCKGSAWGDYDNDGDPDLYVSNFGHEISGYAAVGNSAGGNSPSGSSVRGSPEMDTSNPFGRNRLYRNNGDGTFTDVAPELGVTEPIVSFAAWFWDYNNDGWLDLFVAGYGPNIEDVAADYLGLPNTGERMRLYQNDGAGGFTNITRETGLYRVHQSMGANFGDMDNDGFLDFYLGTGYPTYDVVAPNIAYRNNEGRSFTDVTFSAGLGHLHRGHGVAFGDLDRDGDQDIFAQIGGFYPGDGFENALYENPGHGNRWLSIRLVGVQSNRAAIGARIKLELAMEDGSRRDVHALVSSGGSFGASSLEQEMGLGRAERILSMEVFWPTSGIRQVFHDLPLDTRIEAREDESEYEVLETRRIKLGGE